MLTYVGPHLKLGVFTFKDFQQMFFCFAYRERKKERKRERKKVREKEREKEEERYFFGDGSARI